MLMRRLLAALLVLMVLFTNIIIVQGDDEKKYYYVYCDGDLVKDFDFDGSLVPIVFTGIRLTESIC
jgi:hypothetical protein